MKKKLSTVLLALAAFMPMTAQNLVKGDYGYLYCHMSDKGEWTAYAVSRDGYNYQDINEGKPIFDQRSMPVSKAVPAMLTSPVPMTAKAILWLLLICAFVRATNGTIMALTS